MRCLVVLLAFACRPGKAELTSPPGATPTDPTAPQTSVPTTSGTLPTPTDPTPAAPVLTDFTGRLHPDFGSVVYAGWTQDVDATVHVEYSVDEGVWLRSPTRSFAAGAHEELLLGVPYDQSVTWRIVAEDLAGSTTSPDQQLDTDPPPDGLPDAVLRSSDPTRYDPSMAYVFVSVEAEGATLGGPSFTEFVDRQGRAVWARKSDYDRVTMHPRISWDGTALLIDQNSYWTDFGLGEAGRVEELRIDGTPVTEWATPGLHHPYTDLPDGSLAYGGWTGWYSEALKVTHADGSNDTLWDCNDWLQGQGLLNYCASNTLNYDPATNELLFSFWSFETVFFIDATTGETHKWIGHLPGSYAFDPKDTAFWHQHGGYVTDAGTFLVSTHSGPDTDEIVLREYRIDDTHQTLHQIWSYGVGDGIDGHDLGEPHRLENGNTLQNTGTGASLREATSDGELVWDIDWDTYDIGRSTPVADLYAFAPVPE